MDDEVLTDEEAKMDTKNPIPTWVALSAIISAVAFGSWTLSTEVHDIRYRSVVTRTEDAEFAITDIRSVDSRQDIIDVKLTTELAAFGKTLEEVRADVKTLLADR